MKKIDLNQTIQLLGNLGVIAGILLLVYELNQNRRMMEAQTRNAIPEKLVDILIQQAASTELRTVVSKQRAGEAFTPEEQVTYDSMEGALWRYRENVNYQYRTGLYEESEYLPLREFWVNWLNTNEMSRQYWCSRQLSLSIDFVSELDVLMENPCE